LTFFITTGSGRTLNRRWVNTVTSLLIFRNDFFDGLTIPAHDQGGNRYTLQLSHGNLKAK
jgi:hypothetical protein